MKEEASIKEMISILIIILILLGTIIFIIPIFLKQTTKNEDNNNSTEEAKEIKEEIKPITDINLRKKEKDSETYLFEYRKKTYEAIYTPDNWHITNSYQIREQNDIAIICKKLIEIHPIHGKDMKTYRKVEDLVTEWIQHNMIYDLLPDNNKWKNNVKDVDLDPKDQGRSMEELYESRTGKKINIEDIIKIYK